MTQAKTVESVANIAGNAEQAVDAVAMWKAFQARMRLGAAYKAVRGTVGLGSALGAIEGSAKSIDDTLTGKREQWLQDYGASPAANPLQLVGYDTARTFQDIGNALTFNQAGRLGEYLSRLGNR